VNRSEQLVERLYFLEHGEPKPCSEILRLEYIDNNLSVRQISVKYFISVGNVHSLLNKYKIYYKELKLL